MILDRELDVDVVVRVQRAACCRWRYGGQVMAEPRVGTHDACNVAGARRIVRQKVCGHVGVNAIEELGKGTVDKLGDCGEARVAPQHANCAAGHALHLGF